MAMPKSVTKINKQGIKFIDNVDKTKYSIEELSRAALRDSAKFIRKKMIEELKQLPGMRRNRRLYKSTQYWVRKRETDLLIGFKHNTWYGARSELGTHNQPARGILYKSVADNIDNIRQIQGKYLSAIEQEQRINALINEQEYVSPDKEEN